MYPSLTKVERQREGEREKQQRWYLVRCEMDTSATQTWSFMTFLISISQGFPLCCLPAKCAKQTRELQKLVSMMATCLKAPFEWWGFRFGDPSRWMWTTQDIISYSKRLHSFEFRLFHCAMSGFGLVLPFLFWLHDNLGDAFGWVCASHHPDHAQARDSVSGQARASRSSYHLRYMWFVTKHQDIVGSNNLSIILTRPG